MKITLRQTIKVTFLTLLLTTYNLLFTASAQSPNLLSYQAVVRDAGGKLVQNHVVGLKISILQTTATGTVVFSETHSVASNADGLVTVSIGGGTPVSGALASVNWSAGPYFLKTEVDPAGGISYTITGTNQLLSVPYALYAAGSGNGWALTGNTGTDPAVNFIGTSDDKNLIFKRAGVFSGLVGADNTSLGINAFNTSSTGSNNSAFGSYALKSNSDGMFNVANGSYSLYKNTSGSYNVATGAYALLNNTTGSYNMAMGESALFLNTTGSYNMAFGSQALYQNSSGTSNIAIGTSALYYNSTGSNNDAIGDGALSSNTSGSDNNAMGYNALYANTVGTDNTAVGSKSLAYNTTGAENTATGNQALLSNTTGGDNTAGGWHALKTNTTGGFNTAMGMMALNSNTTASYNSAFGSKALASNSTGTLNTAIGSSALFSNTTGSNNIAIGTFSLFSSISGNENTAVGVNSLSANTTGTGSTATGSQSLVANTTGSGNTAIGIYALYSNTTGSGNVALANALVNNITGNYNTGIGYLADVTATNLTNATAIGYNAAVSSSNAFVFGNSSVTGWGFGVNPGAAAIRVGSTAANGNGATLTLTGVWTNASDISKKYNITEIIYGLTDIMKLHPVSYKLKGTDNEDIGFIAQEVKEIVPEIVYGEDGQMSMSYGQLTSVLVKAVQEQQLQIETQQKEIEELKALVDRMAVINGRKRKR